MRQRGSITLTTGGLIVFGFSYVNGLVDDNSELRTSLSPSKGGKKISLGPSKGGKKISLGSSKGGKEIIHKPPSKEGRKLNTKFPQSKGGKEIKHKIPSVQRREGN
jgi:hypothetical protein